MSYRFQKFADIYPEFVQQFLTTNPDHNHLSYQELYDRFVRTRYGLSNFYATHMEALGNKAQDLFATLEPLQKAWAREHGVKYGEDAWLRDIVLAQVDAFQPDVLYLQDLYLFDRGFRNRIREVCGDETIIIGWRSAPTNDFTVFSDLDLVLTAAPRMAQKFRQGGTNVALIRLAFEPTILDEVPAVEERNLDFTFVGSLGSRTGHHLQRYATVERLLPSTPLEVWGGVREYGGNSWNGRALKTIYHLNRVLSKMGISREQRAGVPLLRRGASWTSDPTLPSVKRRYPRRFHRPVYGIENYAVLARSKIVFNSHIDAAEDYAGNLRLYEATGMGACLLTDWKVNLCELFDVDTEVVTYQSPEECIEKVSYLLKHEEERKAIAASGQRRTLRDHTFAQRVTQLHEIVSRLLSN